MTPPETSYSILAWELARKAVIGLRADGAPDDVAEVVAIYDTWDRQRLRGYGRTTNEAMHDLARVIDQWAAEQEAQR